MSECMSKIFTRIDKMEQPTNYDLDACSNFNALVTKTGILSKINLNNIIRCCLYR